MENLTRNKVSDKTVTYLSETSETEEANVFFNPVLDSS